jgi:hypothetical protein
MNREPPEADEPEIQPDLQPEGELTLEEAAANKLLNNAAQNMSAAAQKYFTGGAPVNILEMQCNMHLIMVQLDKAMGLLTAAGIIDRASFWAECAADLEKVEGSYRRATLNTSRLVQPGFRPGKGPKGN